MSSGVKGIFKVLILTIIVIAFSSLIIELFNARISGNHVNQMMNRTIKYSADYFSQETYKYSKEGLGNMPSATGLGGASVSGIFYEGSNPEDVHESLYRSNSRYTSFANNYKGIWENLNYVDGTGNDLMSDALITPSNMGVTYLDVPTLQRIARWSMTKIMSNGLTNNIDSDIYGVYVKYNGFKIYTDNIIIKDIDYQVVSVGSSDFKEITGLNAYDLGYDSSDQETSNILVANVEFSVPVRYIGVTPLKNIVGLIWDVTVDSTTTNVDGVSDTPAAVNTTIGTFNQNASNLFDGGGRGSSTLPITGRVQYYVIR